jgi:EH domain-containing protein 1
VFIQGAFDDNFPPSSHADGDGRVTGPDAVTFFGRSGLARDQLAKVWAFADNTRRGYLDFEAFVRALELISMAQSTGVVSLDEYKVQKAIGIRPPTLQGLPAWPAPEEGIPWPGATSPFDTQDRPGPSAAEPSVMVAPQSPPGGGKAPSTVFYFGGPKTAPGHVIPTQPLPLTSTPPVRQLNPPLSTSASRKRGPMSTKDVTSITDGLKKIYFTKIRPLEEAYKFGHVFSPLLSEGDFEAKPSVLLLGQYSTGKTTFIKYLLGREYPGIHIGPEPTTDRFVVVMHGPEDRRIPGNTLVVQTDKPFTDFHNLEMGFCPSLKLRLVTTGYWRKLRSSTLQVFYLGRNSVSSVHMTLSKFVGGLQQGVI